MNRFLRFAVVAATTSVSMLLWAGPAAGWSQALSLQSDAGTEYVVQPGETLEDIAESFGLTVDEILGANPQLGSDELESGQVLFIPPNVAGEDSPGLIIVPEGDEVVPDGFVELIITTEPILADYPVKIDGNELRTNQNGQLRVLAEEGDHQLSAPEVYQYDEDTRVIFARWSDEWPPSRAITLRRTTQLALGLYVQHFVSFEFVDGLGEPVDTALVDSVVMLNSNGETFTFSDEGENGSLDGVWLTRNRLRRTGGVGLLEKPNVYTFRSAFFRGVDAVQRGRDEFIPSRDATWVVPLLLFPLEVEIRNFGFNRLADAVVSLNFPDEATTESLTATAFDGIARFDQVPPGDFELEVTAGGFSPVTPIVFTGPKVEHLTIITAGLAVVGTVLGLLAGAAIMMFIIRPIWRVRILVAAGLLMALLLSVPSIGAVVIRPLSAEIEPLYDTQGVFVGIEATVRNDGSIMIAQIYCQPDFELRIIGNDQIWSASYESHDFHDVEMGECREHRVAPGVSRHIISPQPGQEWSVIPNVPLPPGRYQAFVRIFDIPAPAITIDLTEGWSEAIQYVDYDPLNGEIPFTNPFED